MAARRTAAAAVLADFRHAADEFIDDTTGTVARPDYSAWAFHLASELGSVLSRLDQEDSEAPDGAAAQLAEVRRVLAEFDWQFHDRQLALEEIDGIVNGADR